MLAVSALNVAANAVLAPNVWWSLWPIAICAYGWAMMALVVTLLALDLHPARAAWPRRCKRWWDRPPTAWWRAWGRRW
jgi:hypothetical protein